MPIDLRDQYFGTEIEMTGITRQRAAQVVAEMFGTDYYHRISYDSWCVRDQQGKEWKFSSDGSIITERKVRGLKTCADGEFATEMVSPKLEYSEMGKRLSSQRNHYAHGDLNQEFIGLSLLDLMYMEYMLYAIQLNYYGIDEKNIRRAINDLFHLNYAIT